MRKQLKQILVVDDSKDNQALLSALFKAKGHLVYSASNGHQALTLLRELTVMPDLIFLDAQMPVMDGYEFRLEQKRDPRLRDIPVAVMSADDSEAMNEKMFEPEIVLKKPLRMNALLETLDL